MKLESIKSKIQFKIFKNCKDYETNKILLIRNEVEIRNNMFTNKIISQEEHKKWLLKIKNDSSIRNFVVYKSNDIIGFFGISQLSILNSAFWSFYISKKFRKVGVGLALEFKALEYLFNKLELKKVFCEVLLINESIIKLHKKFGFVPLDKEIRIFQRKKENIEFIRLVLEKKKWIEAKKKIKKIF